MSNHLNDFNTIYNNLVALEVEFLDLVKALFLLITFPDSWDTFGTAISNSAPPSGPIEANVASSLLTEKVNRKNLDSTQSGMTLYVWGRSQDKGKSQDRARSKSNSRGSLKNIECYNCGKKGYLKKDCRSSKKDKKEKQDKGKKKQDESSSGVKIEEINAVDGDSEEGEILLNSGLESS